MIYFIGVWLVLLLVCPIVGIGLLNGLSDINLWRLGDRFILALWLGIILFAVTALGLSLQWPLTPWLGVIVMLVLMDLAWRFPANRQAWRQLWQQLSRRQVGLGISAVVLVAAVMSRAVTWHDAGYYHASVIRWLSQYGSVHGLALIFSNLGFTSSWFAFVSPLSRPAYAGYTSAVGNGFAALIMVLHGLIVGHRVVRRQAQMSDWFMLIFATVALLTSLFVSPFSQIMVSPSPDFPVLLLVGTIAWLMLVICQFEPPYSARADRMSVLPFALALGAVSIKLTAIPTVLVGGLFLLLSHRLAWSRLLLGAGLSGVLMGPNVLASIRTSGCPLYPSAVLCVDRPWAPTRQQAHAIAASTHDWTSWLGTPPAGANPWLWAVTQLVKTPRDFVTFFLVGLAVLAGLALLLQALRTVARRQLPGEFWVVLLGLVGLGFLFLTSIFTRFLFPYMLILFALSVTWLGHEQRVLQRYLKILVGRWPSCTPRGIYLSITGLSTIVLAMSLILYQGANAIVPPPMMQSAMTQKVTNTIAYASPQSGDLAISIENAGVYQSDDLDRCWAVAIPCAYNIPDDVQLRDPARGIGAGFVRRSALNQQP
ncbi:hypothetical protein IQ266_13315 [filamentous cyanobacterium LEGE 11480]|uniref:DUF8201 domain-containing protein n=1 Tax=Romeriopsis navalis LEGE 11480 TaxID=2777977 RepID=A0A928Z4Z4_9CYAN|nr:hypothetical protein [Romeriopsis navalis]MBE9030710.1 hypothetical protein [Romeriopsis navalis LEGE 11480]